MAWQSIEVEVENRPVFVGSGRARQLAKKAITRAADLDIPEQRLWFAVMLQGIDDRDSRYLESEEFELHCQALSISPDFVRRVLGDAGFVLEGARP